MPLSEVAWIEVASLNVGAASIGPSAALSRFAYGKEDEAGALDDIFMDCTGDLLLGLLLLLLEAEGRADKGERVPGDGLF